MHDRLAEGEASCGCEHVAMNGSANGMSVDEGSVLRDWFDSCRTDLESSAEKWCEAAASALELAHGSADSMRIASRLYHAKRALDRMHPFLPKRFVELLELSMTERLGGAGAPVRMAMPCEDLGLVDDDIVKESIEVSRMATRVLIEAEWLIREAEAGLSLRLTRKVDVDRVSPFHPEAFARAAWRLTEEMSLNTEERAACMRIASDATANFARATCENAIAWLGHADPAARFVVKHSKADAQAMIPVDVLVLGIEPLEPPRGDIPASRDASTERRPLDARDEVFRSAINSIDAVLADFRLTSELKRILSGLQMVVMRFALGSPETLYAPDHLVWSMNRKVVDYALTHCLRDRVAHDDFILFADHVIQTLLQLDANSMSSIFPHLKSIDEFMRTRPHQLIANEETAMQHLARLEDRRRKVLGAAINRHRERIGKEIGSTEIPFRLRQFMLADWAEVLARAELSEGTDSRTYADYWRAVLRVIARVRASDSGSRTAEDAVEVSSLLEVLDLGMAGISVPSVEKHELASALLRPGASRHEWLDTDLQPDTLVDGGAAPQPSRQAFWGARESEGESWMIGSTAGLTSAIPASDAEHWVNSLCEGSLIEIFLLGTWFEARLMSISGAGNLFLFKDELGNGSHPLTRRALLRLVREGLAGPWEQAL